MYFPLPPLAGCSRGDAKRGDVIPALSVAEWARGGVQLGLKRCQSLVAEQQPAEDVQ